MQHRNWLSFFFVFMLALCTKDGRTAAQQNLGDLVNNNTVGLISAGIEGTYVKIASDLSKALDNKYNFRVVPIIGKGSKKNIEDLLYLEGVDLAIVQSDVLDFYGRDPEHKFPDIDEKVFYITKLYNEEVHLIARRDITSIGDLAGMKVSYGPEGGGSALTAENIFDVLGVRADFVEYHYVDALKELRQGNIQALIHVAGKKVKDYETIPPEDGLHLLSLPEQSFDS
ncbi:MAG: TAXI family TRAP transporter solute-binding subunit, partial [Geminicoccaceae bacterium]